MSASWIARGLLDWISSASTGSAWPTTLAAVSSVALCVAGVVHTALLSLPATQRLVHALVGPRPKS